MKNIRTLIIAMFIIIEIGAAITFSFGDMSVISFALISITSTLGVIAQKLSLKNKN